MVNKLILLLLLVGCSNSIEDHHPNPDGEQQVELLTNTQRSPKWEATSKQFRCCYPNDRCWVCGTKTDLNVHHIVPFHNDPSKELDTNNLITLCRKHHFHDGHKDNWSKCNPDIKKQYPNPPK